MMRILIVLLVSCVPLLAQAATFTVTNNNDSGAGSLRQAILDAEASAGADDIDFDGVTGTIDLNSDLPQITESLTITGPGADQLTIDADGGGRIFFIESAGGDQDLVVSGLTLTGATNSALKNGSGSANELDTLTVDACTLTGNSSGSGGAINPNGGTTVISNSTIYDNEGGDGGGIRVKMATQSVQVTIINTTISGNRANENGGGIEVDIGTVLLNNVTLVDNISDNDADNDGDGGGFFVSPGASLSIKNTIVAGNSDMGGEGPDCAGTGTIDSDGYNFVGDTTGCSLSAETGDQFDKILDGTFMLTDLIDTTLADNGGRTLTHALVTGSPAIDVGNPLDPGAGGLACEDEDQRGINRPEDGDNNGTALCDVGAFELESESEEPEPEPESQCGNGTVDDGEDCDDGNTDNGDGCSDSCQFEAEADLDCSNPNVDFASDLTENETVTLEAPDASCGGPAFVLAQSLPDTCTCAWTINPEARGSFGAADQCSTPFTPGPAGTGQISVDVDCGADGTGTFNQSIVVTAASSGSGGGCSLLRR